jgi:tryptophan-rich sensory protein
MDFRTYYDALAKPSWTPSPQTIGLIWTVLYPVIAVAAVGTAVKVWRGELTRWILVPLLVNLAANAAFTWIQFGLRNLPLATIDILVVLISIAAWAVLVWRPGSQWIAWCLVPYFVWVATATVLQVSITRANR